MLGWGVVSQAPVLKVWVTDVGYKHFAPQGEALLSSSPLWVTALGVGFMARLCCSLSYLFLCGLPDMKGLLLCHFLEVFFPPRKLFHI